MKVLFADKLSLSCVKALESAGHSVQNEPTLKGDALVEAVSRHKPEVLLVRSTRVPPDVMAADPSLELIVRAGAGYDNIDVKAASDRGIFVANCPGKNAAAVAELTLGLILALDRSIPDNVNDARAGKWNKAKYSKAAGLKGRTLGIIGTGNIGCEVIQRALGFEMLVHAWSRSLTDEGAAALGVARWKSPLEAVAQADIVSIHLAASPDTEHVANHAFFEAMKPGAFFINTSRSSVVDEVAMLWAMNEKGIRVALDVMSDEPAVKDGPFSHSLASHPNVYITHHIGASTQQAQEAIADEAVRVVNVYADTGRVPNCVNMAERSVATHQLTVRHRDKIGVLAAILDEVRKADWNVQEMENLIFEGGAAACANIRFDGPENSATIERISAHPDVLAVTIIQL